jgi:hypothetical protein
MSEGNLDNSMIYRQSQVEEAGTTYLLARMKGEKVLVVEGDGAGFEGSPMGNWLVCPLSSGNAATLRQRLAWLHPQPLGLVRSAGWQRRGTSGRCGRWAGLRRFWRSSRCERMRAQVAARSR